MRAWRRVWSEWRAWMWAREGVLAAQWAWCILLIRHRLHSLGPFPALAACAERAWKRVWYFSQ